MSDNNSQNSITHSRGTLGLNFLFSKIPMLISIKYSYYLIYIHAVLYIISDNFEYNFEIVSINSLPMLYQNEKGF